MITVKNTFTVMFNPTTNTYRLYCDSRFVQGISYWGKAPPRTKLIADMKIKAQEHLDMLEKDALRKIAEFKL